MFKCNSCPRKCNADRNKKMGYCGVGSTLRLARAGLHFGEEPFISGVNGSGTIFFSGCNLKCVFCQNYNISHNCFGKDVSDEHFIDIMKKLEEMRAHNINLVTPTHYFSTIEKCLSAYKPNIPLVYNSGGYDEVGNIQKDLFDIYLFDLKFFSPEKSYKYCGAKEYFKQASESIKTAVEIVGKPTYDANGIMKRGVVVRHLVMPQSTNDSIQIIDWLNNFTPDIVLSLMSQYLPMHKADEFKEINRKITSREYNKVVEHCYNSNFFDVFIQERTSATKELIPDFDLTGII